MKLCFIRVAKGAIEPLSECPDSNRGPLRPKRSALPAALHSVSYHSTLPSKALATEDSRTRPRVPTSVSFSNLVSYFNDNSTTAEAQILVG
jgi:hypothetical protein